MGLFGRKKPKKYELHCGMCLCYEEKSASESTAGYITGFKNPNEPAPNLYSFRCLRCHNNKSRESRFKDFVANLEKDLPPGFLKNTINNMDTTQTEPVVCSICGEPKGFANKRLESGCVFTCINCW